MKRTFVICIILLSLIIMGCTSNTNSPVQQEKQPSDSDVQAPDEKQVQKPTENTVPEPIGQGVMKMGTTTSNSKIKITVNSVKFISKIDEANTAAAPDGEEFAVVDITIENIQPKDNIQINANMLTVVKANDGTNYPVDVKATSALTNGYKIGNFEPGEKKEGELAYLVPKNAEHLQWIYKLDLAAGTNIVYQVK